MQSEGWANDTSSSPVISSLVTPVVISNYHSLSKEMNRLLSEKRRVHKHHNGFIYRFDKKIAGSAESRRVQSASPHR